MSTENDSLIGKQLGAYRVQAKLGEGGMAVVYRAYHPRLRREVAIKVILSEIADREGFQARFEREAQVIASLEHPNIVSIYDFATEGHLTYLVMQYVGGGTLRDQMRGARFLDPQRATQYAIQMARALHHAHQRGVVHRDVKPQNMLISSFDPNHLLLSDFGIAKLYHTSEELSFPAMPTRTHEDLALTGISQVIGTADYMSPEQALGNPVDARSDVYALGVVLYQMLTGDVPFHSTTLSGLLYQHAYVPPPPVREKNPLVPEVLAWITARAMAKTPEDRFQTAEAMAQALARMNIDATNPLPPPAQEILNTPPQPRSISEISTRFVSGSRQSLSNPPGWNEEYARYSDMQTRPDAPRVTQPPDTSLPTTGPGITGTSRSNAKKRPFPLSYVLVTLALIFCLVVIGMRALPGLVGNAPHSTGGGANNGTAQAFSETFQDNSRDWQTGNLNNGVTASTPGGGTYAVTVPANRTALPYPQAVGTLPASFTLTAEIQQISGSADAEYGIAFHFSEDSSGNNIHCYALVVNSSGDYQILECKGQQFVYISQGSYQPNGKQHTLRVKAQSSSYSFFIDGREKQIAIGNHPATSTWNDSTFRGGQLTLLFSGGATGAEFEATRVQLSIP
jgi:serine/threonine protein kinase